MTLRNKSSLLILVALGLSLTLIYLFSSTLLMKGYLELEERFAIRNLERVVRTIGDTVDNIAVKTSDWASWDDTYQFIRDRNQSYIDSNLQLEGLIRLGVNYMLFLNLRGEIVESRAFDLKALVETTLPSALRQFAQSGMFTQQDPGKPKAYQGIVLLSDAPLMFAALPILSSNGEGPGRGMLIFARILDEDQVKRIAQLANVAVTILPYDTDLSPQGLQEARAHFIAGEATHVERVGEDLTRTFGSFPDVFGHSSLLVIVEAAREVYSQGKVTLRSLMMALTCSMIVVGLFILLLLEKSVLKRLARLAKEVERISLTGESGRRMAVDGNDELAHLAAGMNSMLSTLQHTERALQDSNERIKTILDFLPAGVMVVDPKSHTVIHANRAAASMCGSTAQDIVGRKCHKHVCPAEEGHCPVTDLGQKVDNSQRALVCCDGSLRPILKTVNHVMLDGQDYLLETFVDISERLRAEKLLEEKISELEDFSRLVVDRELKMVELKNEVNQLKLAQGMERKYEIEDQ